MDNLEDLFYNILEIEDIDEILFKKIEINPDKIIYFAFRESQKIIRGKLSSATIKPVGFILKMGGQYYYCPLDKKGINEEIIKEFVNTIM